MGIVLLSGVASFSPTPVYGEMYCTWSSPVDRDTWESQGGGLPDQVESEDYTHVMPGIKATAFTTEVNGTVKFSYESLGDSIKEITAKVLSVSENKKVGSTTPFDYGIKLTNPYGKSLVWVKLFCEHSNGLTETLMQPVDIKDLASESESSDDSQDDVTPEPIPEPIPGPTPEPTIQSEPKTVTGATPDVNLTGDWSGTAEEKFIDASTLTLACTVDWNLKINIKQDGNKLTFKVDGKLDKSKTNIPNYDCEQDTKSFSVTLGGTIYGSKVTVDDKVHGTLLGEYAGTSIKLDGKISDYDGFLLYDVELEPTVCGTTPIVTIRGHTVESDLPLGPDPQITAGHTGTDYDTTGDIPGLEKGNYPDEIVIYIHGFGNDEDDAKYNFNSAKCFLVKNNYNHSVIGFSWDSDPGILDFHDAKIIAEINEKKLSQFIMDFKTESPDTEIRFMGHSLGSRVILTTIQDLYDQNWGHKIASVHLMGAAVDNEVVGKEVTGEENFGVVIESIVGEFHNKYNFNDAVLSGTYFIVEGDQALGEDGAESGIELPSNYCQENVTKEVGWDHSAYIAHVMDNAVRDWRTTGLGPNCLPEILVPEPIPGLTQESKPGPTPGTNTGTNTRIKTTSANS